jgi:hypothetical protein
MFKRPAALVRTTVLAVGVIYSLVLFAAGSNSATLVRYLMSCLPALAVVLLLVWDLWMWRLPGARRLTHRPRIEGLWQGLLQPTAESLIPTGGNRGPIPIFLIVRQSYWSLHLRQYTAESASDSRAYFWERVPGTSVDRLSFLYDNLPRPSERPRSSPHQGSCSFDNQSLCPSAIHGVYFTDRYTQGEIDLTFVDRSNGYGSFTEAQAHATAAHVKND